MTVRPEFNFIALCTVICDKNMVKVAFDKTMISVHKMV